MTARRIMDDVFQLGDESMQGGTMKKSGVAMLQGKIQRCKINGITIKGVNIMEQSWENLASLTSHPLEV